MFLFIVFQDIFFLLCSCCFLIIIKKHEKSEVDIIKVMVWLTKKIPYYLDNNNKLLKF